MPQSPKDFSRTPRVALPETRQLDLLARILESRNIDVVRCPMVAIHDAIDPEPVVDWMLRFIESPPELFIIYTGEGINRLIKAAQRADIDSQFLTKLHKTPLLTRGPKPVRALRAHDIKPEFEATAPTTEGVIAALETMQLQDKRIGVQLYGSDPNETLMTYLRSQGAIADCVAPYVYASESDDQAIVKLIQQMQMQEIDAIAFTSKSQFKRLQRVASRFNLTDELKSALSAITVAAVGPVMTQELEDSGIRVDVVPDRNFYMKPLVSQLIKQLDTRS